MLLPMLYSSVYDLGFVTFVSFYSVHLHNFLSEKFIAWYIYYGDFIHDYA